MSYSIIGLGGGDLVDQAITRLPPCYSKSFDDCINERDSTFRDCDLINLAYKQDFDRMQAAVDEIPFCQDLAGVQPAALVLAGAFVATAGVLAWKMLS